MLQARQRPVKLKVLVEIFLLTSPRIDDKKSITQVIYMSGNQSDNEANPALRNLK